MYDGGNFTLWLSVNSNQYYQIPINVSLPYGRMDIVNLNGDVQNVDPAGVATYEISKEEAKQHLRAQLEPFLALLQEMSTRFGLVAEEKVQRPLW